MTARDILRQTPSVFAAPRDSMEYIAKHLGSWPRATFSARPQVFSPRRAIRWNISPNTWGLDRARLLTCFLAPLARRIGAFVLQWQCL
ncbi:MAG: hypothetical protein DCC52_12675 [Chloroflexi bacterium]|nr:MAG: hypothetical protein DCC52_12675 [Chloroflexota bacterium]